MKRIGINALYMIPGGVGGTEIYLRCMLEQFSRLAQDARFIVFTNRETGRDLAPDDDRFETVVTPVRAAFRPWRILYEQLALPAKVAARKIDVLLNPGFTAPLLCPVPQVTVFHDLQHKRHPEYFRWFDLPFWRLLLFGSAIASDVVIAASEPTYADLFRFYPLKKDKVRLILHGVEESFFTLGWQPETAQHPYVLCVSTLHPHKNLERLIRVFAQFRRSRPEFLLVLAGMRGFRAPHIEALIRDLGLRDAVEIPGWMDREKLLDLYRRAHCFIYPSLFEGFGLPVLEAMAAGIPTACSAVEPMAGLAGDGALTFEPSIESDLLRALEAVACDPSLRERLHDAGPQQARQFTWARTARETLAVLAEVAGTDSVK